MYTKEVISLGLFYEEYEDSVREGDGSRVLRCLKYLLPIFKGTNHKNYSLEVLYTLYQYYYILSPREAEEMLWCRFVNVSGLPGKNIAADLHMEHLNRTLNDSIRQPTNECITRAGKAIGTLHPVLRLYDKAHNVKQVSGAHRATKFEKDLKLLTKQLVTNMDVFLKISGRYHHSFKSVKSSSLKRISTAKLKDWIKDHI